MHIPLDKIHYAHIIRYAFEYKTILVEYSTMVDYDDK